MLNLATVRWKTSGIDTTKDNVLIYINQIQSCRRHATLQASGQPQMVWFYPLSDGVLMVKKSANHSTSNSSTVTLSAHTIRAEVRT